MAGEHGFNRSNHYIPMDITKIPFNHFIGITSQQNCTLSLPFTDDMNNHIGTMHASAQFALGEACSGLALRHHFKHLEGKAVPVLRKTETKFHHPAETDISARAEISEKAKERFLHQFERKGRAAITVSVMVVDSKGETTMSGNFTWFVASINKPL